MSEEFAPWEVLLEPEPDSETEVSSCARSCTMKSGVSISACATAGIKASYRMGPCS
jgi:hypothetical protein